MKLSEALRAGARLLKTQGPDWELGDCWDALAAGLHGARQDTQTVNQLYWENPWGITPNSDLEMWLRLVVVHKLRWFDVITRLEKHSA